MCLSRLSIRPQQPTSCTPSFGQSRVIVTLVPVILSTALVCMMRSTDPVAKPIVLECALPRQEDVRHGIQLGLCVAQVATCKVFPYVLCLKESADLDDLRRFLGAVTERSHCGRSERASRNRQRGSITLKSIIDAAISDLPFLTTCSVFRRTDAETARTPVRDVWANKRSQ